MAAVRLVTSSQVDTFYTSGPSELRLRSFAIIRKPNLILVVIYQVLCSSTFRKISAKSCKELRKIVLNQFMQEGTSVRVWRLSV